ncbi:DUF1752-domain-containing protein [Pleomassaria siparia CBS 279.74]|uniref:DUF1752-domain-containing protein n=1 Tax=Pleomassaria siparia CBS 279.74 TaxID=1314801 RepID=A0A6G1KM93_9PLEO|nr:DUF1752-domain-containing protein [Pleomassaria siparia CBS 279.74]
MAAFVCTQACTSLDQPTSAAPEVTADEATAAHTYTIHIHTAVHSSYLPSHHRRSILTNTNNTNINTTTLTRPPLLHPLQSNPTPHDCPFLAPSRGPDPVPGLLTQSSTSHTTDESGPPGNFHSISRPPATTALLAAENMPLITQHPIVRVETGSIHTIETRDPQNLFGLWSVFSKCSPAMEDGKRYENLAWRLWGRETFCCVPDYPLPPRWSLERQLAINNDAAVAAAELPELSTSVASDDSNSEGVLTATTRSNSSSLRPNLRRHDSANSQAREARGKHMTPIDLEKVVHSIQEKRAIEPLSPLPPQLAAQTVTLQPKKHVADTKLRPTSPPPARRYAPESSTSTVATVLDSASMSPPVGSDVSTSTDLSAHSVVHGFDPSRISTSVRSSTNLVPTPILKTSVLSRHGPSRALPQPVKRKQPMFLLGGSSDEDALSSLETSMSTFAKRSSLSDSLKPLGRKTTFKNEVSTQTIPNAAFSEESEGAIESDSDEDESDDNAIEEEDSDDEEWEDDDEVASSSVTEFHRVDSKPNLVSRRSLLTTALSQGERAQALQNAASRSTPAIRRSRTSTPNGPSTGNSPQEDGGLMMRPQATHSKPIIMTTSNMHPPTLSPRTTRRNMLQTELTQSLRQNLLWERQQKNATTNAVNKRNQSVANLPALRRAMTTNDIKGLTAFPQQGVNTGSTFRDAVNANAAKNNNSYNDYFDQGLQEYHQKGW